MAAEMFLVCGEDANRSGSPSLEYSRKLELQLAKLLFLFPFFKLFKVFILFLQVELTISIFFICAISRDKGRINQSVSLTSFGRSRLTCPHGFQCNKEESSGDSPPLLSPRGAFMCRRSGFTADHTHRRFEPGTVEHDMASLQLCHSNWML